MIRVPNPFPNATSFGDRVFEEMIKMIHCFQSRMTGYLMTKGRGSRVHMCREETCQIVRLSVRWKPQGKSLQSEPKVPCPLLSAKTMVQAAHALRHCCPPL